MKWLALPLVLGIASGPALGVACRPAATRGQLVDRVAFQRLTPGDEPVLYSGITLVTRTVVTDAATFDALWRQAFADPSGNSVPPPRVDWAHEKVVFVALGERPSGGHAIRVTGVQRVGDEMLIDVESTSPGNCPSAAVMTQPVDVVRIPRADAKVLIRFVERERISDCR